MRLEDYKKKLHARGLGRFFKTKPKEEQKGIEGEKSKENDDGNPFLNPKSISQKKTQAQTVSTVQNGISQLEISKEDSESCKDQLPSDEMSPKDKGIPLRLYKGKNKNKANKFMTTKEAEKQECRYNTKRKKIKETQDIEVKNKKIDKMIKKPKK